MVKRSGLPIVGDRRSAGGIEALEALFRADAGATPASASSSSRTSAPGRESAAAEILGRFTAMPVRRRSDGDRGRARPRLRHARRTPRSRSAQGRLRVRAVDAGAPRAQPDRRLPRQPRRGPGRARHRHHPLGRRQRRHARHQGDQGARRADHGAGRPTTRRRATPACRRAPSPPASSTSCCRSRQMPASSSTTSAASTLAGRAHGRRPAGRRSRAGRAGAPGDLRDPARPGRPRLRRLQGEDLPAPRPAADAGAAARRRSRPMSSGCGRSPTRSTQLFRDLLIGVTNFFRDPEAFEALERLVMPQLFEGKGADDTVRIWVPGCATGEEAYSIAILLREHMDGLAARRRRCSSSPPTSTSAALDVARGRPLPGERCSRACRAERLQRFFAEDGGSYVVAKEVRDMCIFSPHSLIRDPPFSRIDLVSCRNLLIYLDAELQEQVIPVFHYALRPGGFLFLGSVRERQPARRPVRRRRQEAPHLPAARPRRGRRSAVPAAALPAPRCAHAAATEAARPDGGGARRCAARSRPRVLEHFAPAYVVVNRDGDVVYYSPRTGKYLEAAAGPAEPAAARAWRARACASTCAPRCRRRWRRGAPSTRERRRGRGRRRRVQPIDLTVEPLRRARATSPLFLVLFADLGPPLTPRGRRRSGAAPGDGDADGDAARARAARHARAAAGDDRGVRDRARGAEVRERGAGLDQRGAAVDQRGAGDLQGGAPVGQRGAADGQPGAQQQDRRSSTSANSDLRNLFESTQIAIVFLDRAAASSAASRRRSTEHLQPDPERPRPAAHRHRQPPRP